MSGLLPRTTGGTKDSSFDYLTANTAVINYLTANNLVFSEATVPNITVTNTTTTNHLIATDATIGDLTTNTLSADTINSGITVVGVTAGDGLRFENALGTDSTVLVNTPSGVNTITVPASTGTLALTTQTVNSSGYVLFTDGLSHTLTNPMPNFIESTYNGASWILTLPAMNASNSLKVAPDSKFFIYNNAASQNIIVNNASGSTLYTVKPGCLVEGVVTSNATTNGLFTFAEIVTLTGTQSLSNKTLSSCSLSGSANTVSGLQTAGGTDYTALIHATGDTLQERVVVVPSGTQTLSNKTLDSTTSFSGINTQTDPTVYYPIAMRFDTGAIANFTNMVTTSATQILSNKTFSSTITGTDTTNPDIILSRSTVKNRKIVLYDGGTNNDYQFYGMGVQNSDLRFNVSTTSDLFNWYCGASTSTATKLMSLGPETASNNMLRVRVNANNPRIILGDDSTDTGPMVARAAGSGNFFVPAAAGDMIIRNNSVGKVLIGTATSTPQITIASAGGNITLNPTTVFSTGLQLPTSGGTATTLNYYEELSTTLTWGSAVYSGGAVTSTVKYTRNGNIVSVYFAVTSGTVSVNTAFRSGTVPARFRPNNDADYTKTYIPIIAINGGSNVSGYFQYDDSPGQQNFNISLLSGAAWTGTAGFQAMRVTYTIV